MLLNVAHGDFSYETFGKNILTEDFHTRIFSSGTSVIVIRLVEELNNIIAIFIFSSIY